MVNYDLKNLRHGRVDVTILPPWYSMKESFTLWYCYSLPNYTMIEHFTSWYYDQLLQNNMIN